MIVEIDGIPVEITRKAIKNMTLRVYPQGLVKVSAPHQLSDKIIKQFLQQKRSWIRTQQERIQSNPIKGDEVLQTGASVWFKGACFKLQIIEQHGPSQIQIHQDLLYCYVPPESTQEFKQLVLDRWYKQQMTLLIPELLQRWEAIIQVKVPAWGIKKMKSRWGSCNTRTHNIWLNLNLIKKPVKCLEYVLVHELTHIHEASHNQRFYRLMTEYLPQWQEYQFLLEGRYLRK